MKMPITHRPEKREKPLSDVDAVILAGGLGRRLRSAVSDRPKVLAEVAGRPFLDILIDNLRRAGCRRIILSVGHMKDQIKDHYAKSGVFFAEEESPLGTGGGIKNAEPLVRGENFLAMNGDSWPAGGVDFESIHNFHKSKNALITLALARPRNEKDYGAVLLDRGGKITSFNEKIKKEGGHFLSAGIYVMSKNVFRRMPDGPFSLETDFFPKLTGEAFYGFPVDGEVVDIGTPERYESANKIFKS